MASITIRNLSEESKARLRRQAERRGCSLEAWSGRSWSRPLPSIRLQRPGFRTTSWRSSNRATNSNRSCRATIRPNCR